MTSLAIITASIMGLVSILHFYWALDGTFGRGSAGPTLEGKADFHPGRVLTFIVATGLACLSLLAFQLMWPSPLLGKVVPYAGYATSFILIARSVGDFKYIGFFKKVYNSKFSMLDTRFFSPLCLFLGMAYGLLSAYGA